MGGWVDGMFFLCRCLKSYRAHLRSFGFYEKMLGSVYSKCHGLFKQSDRFRMGNHRASVVGGVCLRRRRLVPWIGAIET